jgi:hypothetical protein
MGTEIALVLMSRRKSAFLATRECPMNAKLVGLALLAAGSLGAVPAYASDTCTSGTTITCTDGISYTLTQDSGAMLGADSSHPADYVKWFSLNITDVNDPGSPYGGKSGVQSFALGDLGNNKPYFIDATAPTGFTLMPGGLNSSGCDSKGSFFCFQADTAPPKTPALAADWSHSYQFSLTGKSVADFNGWDPGFKINWIGSQNNYDLVSKELKPTAAPEIDPANAAAALTFLAGGLAMLRRRRRAG